MTRRKMTLLGLFLLCLLPFVGAAAPHLTLIN